MKTNLTRNGVAKDLKTSPYTFTEVADAGVITFYFSSRLHLNNFCEKRDDNYSMIYNYIYKRFKFKVDCQMLSDCNLYQKIESRGFYITINKKEFLCPSSIILNGESKMSKSLDEWRETLMLS